MIVPSVVEQLKTEILVKLAECDRFIPSHRSSFITEAQLRTHLETVITQESSRDFILQVLLEERKISKLNLDKLTVYKLAVADEPVDVDEVDKGLLHLKGKVKYNIEDDIVVYFCFPTLGVAVPLRPVASILFWIHVPCSCRRVS